MKLITKIASATFLLALMLASEANAESRLPPCPKDRSVSWDNCHGTLTLPNGVEYVGEFKDGKANGQGTYTFLNGGKYVGEFRDDSLDGQGTLTYPDGRKYVGEFKFKDGKLNGQGTVTYPDGAKYVGEFRDDLPNGQGTHTWPNGDKYVGEWKAGKLNGQGTYTWRNGEKYVGERKGGKMNGPGTLYSSDGFVRQSGIWQDDILVPQTTDYFIQIVPFLLIAGGIAIAIFLRKDRTKPLIRVFTPTDATKVPATELEGGQRPQQPEQVQQTSPTLVSQAKMENNLENGPRPVSDAEMDAWRASLGPPESRPEQVQQPSPTSVSRASEFVQALERLSQVREKGILSDAEFEQERKRILA